MSQNEVANLLSELAEQEFHAARQEIARLRHPQPIIYLMEACRVFDFRHVTQFMGKNPANRLSDFDFDIMVRGWNPLLGFLLPHVREMGGIPAMESTPAFRKFVLSILLNLGSANLLRENARMILHGMAEGAVKGNVVTLRMSPRCQLDHFLDRLEQERLERIEKSWPGADRFNELIKATEVENLDARIDALVFPWRLSDKVTMVGYGAEPDIDAHYIARVTECTQTGRNDAGIHPEARFGSVSGSDLNAIVLLISSFYLKHIRFVDRGKGKFPEVNYPMSLTIWKSKRELVNSIAEFTGISPDTVTAAIDLIIVKSEHSGYFQSEPTMFVPMLIEISEDYLLAPVSSAFRNPFHGIRMLFELKNRNAIASVRAPREEWMISDLLHLFLGERYERMQAPARLRRNGMTVTDIDAAIMDRSTGELALFQLKWQDFNSNDVTKQRSRAKNFVEKVDSWANETEKWISEFGRQALCQALRIRGKPDAASVNVRLFAIGRSAARFRSYGYLPKTQSVAACAWRQFVRLRHDIGPSENVFKDLHLAIQAEQTKPVTLVPLRQEMTFRDHTIVFEDLWNQFDDAL